MPVHALLITTSFNSKITFTVKFIIIGVCKPPCYRHFLIFLAAFNNCSTPSASLFNSCRRTCTISRWQYIATPLRSWCLQVFIHVLGRIRH